MSGDGQSSHVNDGSLGLGACRGRKPALVFSLEATKTCSLGRCRLCSSDMTARTALHQPLLRSAQSRGRAGCASVPPAGRRLLRPRWRRPSQMRRQRTQREAPPPQAAESLHSITSSKCEVQHRAATQRSRAAQPLHGACLYSALLHQIGARQCVLVQSETSLKPT